MAPVNYSGGDMSPADTWTKMLQMQAAGLDSGDQDLGDVGALASMTPEPKPAQAAAPGPWTTKVSQTIRTPVANPQMQAANADMLELVKLYNQKQQEALKAQAGGVDQLASQVQNIQNMPSNPVGSFRPLAQFYGMNPSALPEQETPEARAQRLLSTSMELQKARQGLSKEQADTLKDQIAALKATKDNSLQDALTLAKTNAFNNVGGRQQNRLDETNYAQMVQDVKKDPLLAKTIQPYMNLSNALDNVTGPDKTPVQQLNELQQTIRGSTGLRGNSGMAERKEDYIHFFGSDGTMVEQYLSGKIVNIPASIKQQILDHLGQIVDIEKKNLNRQAGARFDQLTAGQQRILKRHPEMQADINQFKVDYMNSLKAMASQPGAAPVDVGHEEGGYRFKGGDVGDKNNWEKIQ